MAASVDISIEEQVSQRLKQHKIRQTECRSFVLGELMRAGFALSHPDLEQQAGRVFDRVTIYRSLNLFLEKGLIHKVLDDAGLMKFALCSDDFCGESEHNHNHVHFKCVNCENTVCLEDLEVPAYQLPAGFQIQDANVLLSGICDQCTQLL